MLPWQQWPELGRDRGASVAPLDSLEPLLLRVRPGVPEGSWSIGPGAGLQDRDLDEVRD